MIKVLLADDQTMFLDGMLAFLEKEPNIAVQGTAHNGDQVIAFLEDNPEIDVVVLDVEMPEKDGVETAKLIKKNPRLSNVKILILTMYNRKDFIVKLMQSGANGYILKNKSKEELISALLSIQNGQKYISLGVLDAYLEYIKKKPTPVASEIVLTSREIEVLKLVAEGKQDKEIANQLKIIETTVYTHCRNLRKKIGVSNRTELAIYARKKGIT